MLFGGALLFLKINFIILKYFNDALCKMNDIKCERIPHIRKFICADEFTSFPLF